MAEVAAASATWVGMMVDLAESGRPVVMTVGSGRLSGALTGIGSDFCVLEREGTPPALVALGAIDSVWPSPDPQTTWAASTATTRWPASPPAATPSAPAGDRPPPLRLSLAAALSILAEERLPVVVSSSGTRVEGHLLSVGEDVVTLRTSAPLRRLVHLRLAAVDVCELR
jgi:hypothetical protein